MDTSKTETPKLTLAQRTQLTRDRFAGKIEVPATKPMVDGYLTVVAPTEDRPGGYSIFFPAELDMKYFAASSSGKTDTVTVRVDMGRSREQLIVKGALPDGGDALAEFGTFSINLSCRPIME